MLREIFRVWCNLGFEIAASQAHSSSCGFVIFPSDHRVDGDSTGGPLTNPKEIHTTRISDTWRSVFP